MLPTLKKERRKENIKMSRKLDIEILVQRRTEAFPSHPFRNLMI